MVERMDKKSKANERFVIWMMIICDVDIRNDNIWDFRRDKMEGMGFKRDHGDIEKLNFNI